MSGIVKSFQNFFFHPVPFPECSCYLRLASMSAILEHTGTFSHLFHQGYVLLVQQLKSVSSRIVFSCTKSWKARLSPKLHLLGVTHKDFFFIKSETTAEPILQLWLFKVVSTRSLKTGPDAQQDMKWSSSTISSMHLFGTLSSDKFIGSSSKGPGSSCINVTTGSTLVLGCYGASFLHPHNNSIYIALFKVPRDALQNPFFIHTTFTPVVVRYVCSHSCPGAHWHCVAANVRQTAPLTTAKTIHTHSHKASFFWENGWQWKKYTLSDLPWLDLTASSSTKTTGKISRETLLQSS